MRYYFTIHTTNHDIDLVSDIVHNKYEEYTPFVHTKLDSGVMVTFESRKLLSETQLTAFSVRFEALTGLTVSGAEND